MWPIHGVMKCFEHFYLWLTNVWKTPIVYAVVLHSFQRFEGKFWAKFDKMSHLDPDNDPSIHRLEGSSGNEKGGLVIMKKGPASTEDKHVFKVPAPRTSILGLDKLAAAKRKQQQEDQEKEERKSRVTSYRDEEEEGDDVESDVTPGRYTSKTQKDRWVRPELAMVLVSGFGDLFADYGYPFFHYAPQILAMYPFFCYVPAHHKKKNRHIRKTAGCITKKQAPNKKTGTCNLQSSPKPKNKNHC